MNKSTSKHYKKYFDNEFHCNKEGSEVSKKIQRFLNKLFEEEVGKKKYSVIELCYLVQCNLSLERAMTVLREQSRAYKK